MNKKLITLAVAAAVAAPMTALAEVTIYGKANVSYDAVKVKEKYGGSGDRQYKVVANEPLAGAPRSSRLGFKGSEDLGGGLKAIWKMEFSVDQADNSPVNSSRNAYVGLASDAWGTAVIGRHDTPYKMATGKYDYFADQLGDFNGTVGFEDIRAPNAVAYISPNWAGFTLAGAIHSNGNDDDWANAYSIAGMYSIGAFNVSAAYERFDDDQLDGTSATRNLAEKKWTLGGSWDSGAFGIAGRWEHQDNPYRNGVKLSDADKWQVSGKFGFGNNVAKAFYGDSDFDSDEDFEFGGSGNTWGLGLDHNFTKRSQAYIQWVKLEDAWDGWSLGMTHKF
jgi:predicted porin